MTDISLRIASDASKLGVNKGDTLFVHSSLRSLGKVSAEDVIAGLREALGEEGTLVLPAYSYLICGPSQREFDYHKTPTHIGALPEYFRTSVEGVLRSLNATHSCCAVGKNAEFITSGHILDNTPCGPNSPFRRLYELKGKILFIGCGMNCNSSMHAVEELSVPDYLFGDEYEYHLTDKDGTVHTAKCLSHNFAGVWQCYHRLESLLSEDDLKIGNILSAKCHLVNTPAMWQIADKKYREDPHYFIDRAE